MTLTMAGGDTSYHFLSFPFRSSVAWRIRLPGNRYVREVVLLHRLLLPSEIILLRFRGLLLAAVAGKGRSDRFSPFSLICCMAHSVSEKTWVRADRSFAFLARVFPSHPFASLPDELFFARPVLPKFILHQVSPMQSFFFVINRRAKKPFSRSKSRPRCERCSTRTRRARASRSPASASCSTATRSARSRPRRCWSWTIKIRSTACWSRPAEEDSDIFTRGDVCRI